MYSERDRKACKQMLLWNTTDVSFASLVKKGWKLQGFRLLLASCAIALVFGMHIEGGLADLCFLAVGIAFGSLLTDSAWCWRMAKSWPLTRQVTNWALVEEIARGEPKP